MQQLARDRADRPVRRERDAAPDAPVAVLDDSLVRVQVERDDERARAVRRRQRRRLPAAGGEAQRRVLELRLRWRERDGELAEHLRVARAACRTSPSSRRTRALANPDASRQTVPPSEQAPAREHDNAAWNDAARAVRTRPGGGTPNAKDL